MKTDSTKSLSKFSFTKLLCASALSILIISAIYFSFGHRLIAAMYEGRAIPFLNQALEGSKNHPLEFYIQKGDRLFYNILILGICGGFLFVISTQIVGSIKSKRKAVLMNVLVFCLSLVIMLTLGEILVRKMGFKPWRPAKEKIKVSHGSHLVQIDPQLGYVTLKGNFEITLADGYVFTVTNRRNGERITKPAEGYESNEMLPQIWIFGCSFTFGWSLNDSQTYPWILQEKLPQKNIFNFGNIGYGTLQSIVYFKELLKKEKKPEVVVYAYASFHDERNTFLRKRRQAVGPANELGPFRQPFARFDKSGNLIYSMTDVTYHEVPFSRQSAFVRLLEDKFNSLEDKFVHSKKITKQLIFEFHQLAKENGIRFVIAGIDSESRDMLDWLMKQGIETVDISVDLSKKEYRNWPHDSHPNAAANQYYAQHLEEILK